jgi:hypothetical protein
MPWNLILGGITGLIGSITTAITNYKIQKLKNQHEEKMIELNTTAMIKEAEANIKITQAETEAAIELADSQAYLKSIELGNKNMFGQKWIDKLFMVEGWLRYIAIPVGVIIAFLFGIVDFMKAFTRPGITWLFTGTTLFLAYISWSILGNAGVDAIDTNQAMLILKQIIDIVLYLTVSCVTWWFGDRRIAKFLTRLNDGNIKNQSEVPPLM